MKRAAAAMLVVAAAFLAIAVGTPIALATDESSPVPWWGWILVGLTEIGLLACSVWFARGCLALWRGRI